MLARLISDALESVDLSQSKEERKKVIAFTRDGSSVNSSAISLLRDIHYKHSIDIQCLSHSANIIGNEMKNLCKTGVKFVNLWNSMIKTSSKAFSLFSTLIGGRSVRTYSGNIRWYFFQECLEQVDIKFETVKSVIFNKTSFADSLRGKLRALLKARGKTIRMEVKLMSTVCRKLMQLCYKQEGDEVLIPRTYDHWNSTMIYLERVGQGAEQLSDVSKVVIKNYHDVTMRADKMRRMRNIVENVAVKMRKDSDVNGRLYETLQISKACRIFDFQWAKLQTTESIQGQLSLLQKLGPYKRIDSIQPLYNEIESYVNLAMQATGRSLDDIIKFWSESQQELPNLSQAFAVIAVIAPSSATVERLFSMLATFKTRHAAKSKYRKASVLLRYNENFCNPRVRLRRRKRFDIYSSDEEYSDYNDQGSDDSNEDTDERDEDTDESD